MKHPEVPGQPVNPDDPSRTSKAARRQPIGIVDGWGKSWWVYERDSRHDPGCPADRCLIFANDSVVRRVWNYPRDWERLSDQELDALGCSFASRPMPRGRTA